MLATVDDPRERARVATMPARDVDRLERLVRMEDYALLMGARLLFGVVAGVMFLTRRVDWYGIRAAA